MKDECGMADEGSDRRRRKEAQGGDPPIEEPARSELDSVLSNALARVTEALQESEHNTVAAFQNYV